LLVRAADVVLKERRKLVLVVRETPLHLGHLRLMEAVTEFGRWFYHPRRGSITSRRPVADIVDHTVAKVLDQLGLDRNLFPRWPEGAVRPTSEEG